MTADKSPPLPDSVEDPRDEEYRAHSGGAAVGVVILIIAAVWIFGGFK